MTSTSSNVERKLRSSPDGAREEGETAHTPAYILVCGSRGFFNRSQLYATLDRILPNYPGAIIVSGCAQGADMLAVEYAEEKGISLHRAPVTKEDWKRYGKAAGLRRNSEMLALGPKLVVAFSSEPFLTAGTADTVRKARSMGIAVQEFVTVRAA